LAHYLDFKSVRAEAPGEWDFFVTARGGGAFEQIDVEPAFGPLHVIGPASVQNLVSGRTAKFHLKIDGEVRCALRVNVPGPDSVTTDVAIGAGP
jgi:hypothetical protein